MRSQLRLGKRLYEKPMKIRDRPIREAIVGLGKA